MSAQKSELVPLPEDRELLAAMVRTLQAERNHEKQRAEAQARGPETLPHTGVNQLAGSAK